MASAWTKNLSPDMTSLESSLFDMHVAQEQHYMLEEFLRRKRFLQKVFLALIVVLVLDLS